ncbi:MAG: DUF7508 domain-containing protein [Caulobacteraceae bacterium]
MGIRLEKPWRNLSASEVASLGAELGVFQLADAKGRVVRIGFAGGRSLFGLRGELAKAMEAGEAAKFRIEVTSQYLSRFEELLMIHQADFGELPAANAADGAGRRGRLSPG